MMDINTKRVVMSRDVTWLGKNYGEHKNLKVNITRLAKTDEDELSDDEEEEENDEEEKSENKKTKDDEEEEEEPKKRNRHKNNDVRSLKEWLDQQDDEDKVEIPEGSDIRITRSMKAAGDIAHVVFDRILKINDMINLNLDDYDEPTTFAEAWNHPNQEKRKKWRMAIQKEFADMNKRQVWRKMKRRDMPNGRRCVKCKWVFKEKRNGVFRARLVACGYSQIAGIDFSENYSPVVNDISYRIMLIILILMKLHGMIADVETAFLHGDLEEDIYMECPEGLDAEIDECLKLLKSIYGLVQAARQWWKKLIEILKRIGFVVNKADPCLLMRKSEKGIVYIGLYVDDCLCIGDKEAINEVLELMKREGLSLKVEENLTDYLSCELTFDKKKEKAWLGQPHLIEKLRKKFGEEVQDMQRYRTPGTPGHGILRKVNEDQVLEVLDQKKYRSGVGMLLYLIKHSRPDIANSVRELSKVMDKPTIAGYKEMKRVIKYVLDTGDKGLLIHPKEVEGEWILQIYSDSDYAGDQETRISVAGYILYLCEVPISWKSKGQKSVSLSSAEAEYVAISEAVKEIRFVYQVLESMEIEINLPIIVRVDNVGAIYMTENTTTSTRTKHVDTRYHFVKEFIDENFLKIVFVRSEDNDADIFTKNTSGDIFEKHKEKMVIRKFEDESKIKEGC